MPLPACKVIFAPPITELPAVIVISPPAPTPPTLPAVKLILPALLLLTE
jgi:hypothetical protein